VLGTRTKTAIRDYQRQTGLPVDGHPSVGLLEHLRQTVADPGAPRTIPSGQDGKAD
jgi:peptidoglycan hydrolase-like protein with peptidoglycan-binding domain